MARNTKTATPTPGTPMPEASHTHLKVVAKRAGFRRAGRAFGDDPVYVPLDELSEDEYLALMSEPMLVAMPVAHEGEAKAD